MQVLSQKKSIFNTSPEVTMKVCIMRVILNQACLENVFPQVKVTLSRVGNDAGEIQVKVKKIRRMNVANIYATLQDITSQMKIEYQVQEKVLHR